MMNNEMFTIGKKYVVHGQFNYGKEFTGKIAAVDNNFIKFVECENISSSYGRNSNTFIASIKFISTIIPAED